MNAPMIREAALDVINSSEMVRAERMVASIFAVWRVLPSGKAQPLAPMADTLPEIERQIACPSNYGHTILIRETDTLTERATLHVYRVRRGKWSGRHNADLTRVYPHIADKLVSVEALAFAPVEPWRYQPGADVVGRGNVIEARS